MVPVQLVNASAEWINLVTFSVRVTVTALAPFYGGGGGGTE